MQPTVHRETLSAELLKYAFFDETTSLARSGIYQTLEITRMHTQGNYCMRVIFYRNLNCIGLAAASLVFFEGSLESLVLSS